MRNLSKGGARLQFQSHLDCPRFIVLRILGGEAYDREVRQFANTIMGVKFLGKFVEGRVLLAAFTPSRYQAKGWAE